MDLDFRTHVTEAVRDMARGDTVGTTVERAVRMCVETIEHCDMACASLVESSGIRTLAASNETLREVDQLQYQLREGPCFDAIRRDEVVTTWDLADDERWPRWTRALVERTDLRSSMSFRLFTTSGSFGVLNMYSARTHGFDDEDVLDGHVLAAVAAVAVATSTKQEQLTQALHTRTVIGQATGVVMERFGLDAETAFSVLRRLSQAHNIKLSKLAVDLVENGVLPRDGH